MSEENKPELTPIFTDEGLGQPKKTIATAVENALHANFPDDEVSMLHGECDGSWSNEVFYEDAMDPC